MAVPSNVQDAINDGFNFRFGDYISKAFQIVQKNMGQFILGTLVLFVMIFGASMVTSRIGTAGMATLGLVAGYLISQLISQVVQTSLVAPMNAGFDNASQKTDTGKVVEFGDFFAGFSKWTQLFVTAIMSSVIVLLASLPGIYLMMQQGVDFSSLSTPDGIRAFMEDYDFSNLALGSLVALIPSLYFTTSYIYAPLIAWFYDISGWEALETSRKLVAKNFFGILGFLIVVMLIFFAGFILVCVGALFTFPVMMAAVYASFADIVGLNSNSAGNSDEVIDHFMPKG